MVNSLRKNALRGFLLFLLMCGMLSFYTSAAIAATDTWDGTISTTGFAGGDGSSGSPYLIATGKQLAYLASANNDGSLDSYGKYFKLTADIDLNNNRWTPIGTNAVAFTGSFDGDGHVISNLKIEITDSTATLTISGLFGEVSQVEKKATIKNLGVEAINIEHNYYSTKIGGLIGQCQYPTDIQNCYTTGTITAGDSSNSTNQSFRTGGLVGNYYGLGSMVNCYSQVNITINGWSRSAGGLVGEVGGGAIVTNCYATGTVSGASANNKYGFGGLLGRLANGNPSTSTVNNSYWNSNAMTTGIGTVDADFTSNGSTAKTSAQMQADAFFGLLNTNRGSNTEWKEWKSDTESKNGGYPMLSDVGVGRVSITVPTTQASALTFSDLMGTGMTINWTNGNGASRAVFVKEGSGDITSPSDSSTYTASADWSSKGTQLGTSGYYCVYNGTGTSVGLNNLSPGTSYTVQVFEYRISG